MAPCRARDRHSPDRDERGRSANLDKDPVERSTARGHKAACVTRLASSCGGGVRAWMAASISQTADNSPCNVLRWWLGRDRAMSLPGRGPCQGGRVNSQTADNSPCNVLRWWLERDRARRCRGGVRVWADASLRKPRTKAHATSCGGGWRGTERVAAGAGSVSGRTRHFANRGQEPVQRRAVAVGVGPSGVAVGAGAVPGRPRQFAKRGQKPMQRRAVVAGVGPSGSCRGGASAWATVRRTLGTSV